MQDLLSMIAALKRPRLLVRAARFGVDDYSRVGRLPRILDTAVLPRSGPAILALLELESALEDARQSDSAEYSVARHVDVLIALMGEARLLRATAIDDKVDRQIDALPAGPRLTVVTT